MARDGTPEFWALALGKEVHTIRKQRRWSRPQLALRLERELPDDDPHAGKISDSLIRRIEEGRIVKLSRTLLEALCRALLCDGRETAWLLLYADRNVLRQGDEPPTAVAEALNAAMSELYQAAYDIVADLLEERRVADLTKQELRELVRLAFHLVSSTPRR